MKYVVWRTDPAGDRRNMCRYSHMKDAMLEFQRHRLAQEQGRFADCGYSITMDVAGREQMVVRVGPRRP